MSDISNIKFKLSGGASNTNPANSLGGAISTSIIPPQTTAVASNTTGLSVTYAQGNPLGSGTLRYYAPVAGIAAKPQIATLTITTTNNPSGSAANTLKDAGSAAVQVAISTGGKSYTSPSLATSTPTTIDVLVADLASKINADGTAIATATASSNVLTVTAKVGNTAYTLGLSLTSSYPPSPTYSTTAITNGYSSVYTNGNGTSTCIFVITQAAAAAVAGDSQSYLSWQPSGDAGGSKVPVVVSTSYALAAASTGTLLVSTPATLPSSDANIAVTISTPYNSLYDDIQGVESLQGNMDYRCFYLKNEDSVTHSAIKLWCSQQPVGDDVIQLGLDAAGVNGVAASIPNDTTAPAGVTFAATNSEAAALNIGTLAAGQYIAVWQKRSISAATRAAVADSFELTLSAL